MQNNAVTSDRRLLPRWRTLSRTPAYELPASRIPAKRKVQRKNVQFENALARWEQTRALAEASELIDAAIVSGNYSIAAPAALSVLHDGNAVAGLINAARQILGRASDRPTPELSFADERSVESIQRKIASLKWRLRVAPRDALSALEIARLQSLIGQTRSAERYIEWAIKLAPNDRFILRSAVRFWTHRSRLGDEQVLRALEVIWASDAVRVDPWVQAAEVSVANICGKTPRWGARAGKKLIHSPSNLIQYSELAGGLAALELSAGGPIKKIRKLIRISLRAPTENALAQAVWARKEVGVDFDINSYLKRMENAYEAAARAAYEAGDYLTCSRENWNWLADESFSARAALAGTFVSTCLLGQYDEALAFAELGLRANPNDPSLLNGKLLALAYLGRVKEAAKLLPHFEAFEGDRNIRPFIYAAHGLVDFRLGDVTRGREYYRRAVEACRGLANPSLAANATMFWLEQELFAGTLRPEEANQMISKLDEFDTQKEDYAAWSPVWNVRKKIITQMLDENVKRNAALQASNGKTELSALAN